MQAAGRAGVGSYSIKEPSLHGAVSTSANLSAVSVIKGFLSAFGPESSRGLKPGRTVDIEAWQDADGIATNFLLGTVS